MLQPIRHRVCLPLSLRRCRPHSSSHLRPGGASHATALIHVQLASQQLKWAVEISRMGGGRMVIHSSLSFTSFLHVAHLKHRLPFEIRCRDVSLFRSGLRSTTAECVCAAACTLASSASLPFCAPCPPTATFTSQSLTPRSRTTPTPRP